MKNRNFRTIAAILLVFAMLFGSLTLASAQTTVTPDSTTDVFVPTTGFVPNGPVETTTSVSDEGETTTSAPDEDETTTGSYDDGYDDGYNDGYNDGWDSGYGNGWNDGYYQGQESNKDIFTTIREKIYEIRHNIKEFFKDLEKKIKETLGISDIDKNYLPSADTANLAGDTEIALICMEFNEKAADLYYPEEPINYIKTEKVGMEITDCPGGKLTAALVNPIIEDYLVDETEEYKYQQYYTSAMQDVYVMPEGLTSAKKTVNDDGTTDYEFVLIDEAIFYDGEDEYLLDSNGELTYGNFFNYDVADVLMFSYLDLDPVKVKKATVYYPGTTIKAKADAEGRLITLDILMPVEGSGTASLYLTSLDVEVKGYRNEGFEISYPGLNIDIDMDGIPDGSQATLKDDEAAAALCEEFYNLTDSFSYGVPDNAVVKTTDTLDIVITDCPGGSTVASIIGPIVDNFTGTKTDEETVSKGDYSYLMDSVYLYPEALTVAEKTVNEDGTTDYKFVLKEEAAHFDGYTTYGVELVDGKVKVCEIYHGKIGKGVYLSGDDFGPATISAAEIYFAGATITAKTDALGRLINYTVVNPVAGTGTGKIGFISATISLSGVETEIIEVTYN